MKINIYAISIIILIYLVKRMLQPIIHTPINRSISMVPTNRHFILPPPNVFCPVPVYTQFPRNQNVNIEVEYISDDEEEEHKIVTYQKDSPYSLLKRKYDDLEEKYADLKRKYDELNDKKNIRLVKKLKVPAIPPVPTYDNEIIFSDAGNSANVTNNDQLTGDCKNVHIYNYIITHDTGYEETAVLISVINCNKLN